MGLGNRVGAWHSPTSDLQLQNFCESGYLGRHIVSLRTLDGIGAAPTSREYCPPAGTDNRDEDCRSCKAVQRKRCLDKFESASGCNKGLGMTQQCVRASGTVTQVTFRWCVHQEGEHYCGKLDCEWGLCPNPELRCTHEPIMLVTGLQASGATGVGALAVVMGDSQSPRTENRRVWPDLARLAPLLLLLSPKRQTRTRHIARAPRNGGLPCEDTLRNAAGTASWWFVIAAHSK